HGVRAGRDLEGDLLLGEVVDRPGESRLTPVEVADQYEVAQLRLLEGERYPVGDLLGVGGLERRVHRAAGGAGGDGDGQDDGPAPVEEIALHGAQPSGAAHEGGDGPVRVCRRRGGRRGGPGLWAGSESCTTP